MCCQPYDEMSIPPSHDGMYKNAYNDKQIHNLTIPSPTDHSVVCRVLENTFFHSTIDVGISNTKQLTN